MWSDSTFGAYYVCDAPSAGGGSGGGKEGGGGGAEEEQAARRCGVTRLAVVVVLVGVTDLSFALDSIGAVLALSHAPLLFVSSQAASMLLLRPLYFALAATMTSVGGLEQALALVLVLIGGKALLEASGVEVPLSSFVAALCAVRVFVGLWLCYRGRDAEASLQRPLTKMTPSGASREALRLEADDE